MLLSRTMEHNFPIPQLLASYANWECKSSLCASPTHSPTDKKNRWIKWYWKWSRKSWMRPKDCGLNYSMRYCSRIIPPSFNYQGDPFHHGLWGICYATRRDRHTFMEAFSIWPGDKWFKAKVCHLFNQRSKRCLPRPIFSCQVESFQKIQL